MVGLKNNVHKMAAHTAIESHSETVSANAFIRFMALSFHGVQNPIKRFSPRWDQDGTTYFEMVLIAASHLSIRDLAKPTLRRSLCWLFLQSIHEECDEPIRRPTCPRTPRLHQVVS